MLFNRTPLFSPQFKRFKLSRHELPELLDVLFSETQFSTLSADSSTVTRSTFTQPLDWKDRANTLACAKPRFNISRLLIVESYERDGLNNISQYERQDLRQWIVDTGQHIRHILITRVTKMEIKRCCWFSISILS